MMGCEFFCIVVQDWMLDGSRRCCPSIDFGIASVRGPYSQEEDFQDPIIQFNIVYIFKRPQLCQSSCLPLNQEQT